MILLLKALFVPCMIWGVSLIGRRWGHAVSGWISGLPLVAGPITLFLALDQGPRFAVGASVAILTTIAACAAHCLAYAWVSRRLGWLASLLIAWAVFCVVAAACGQLSLGPGAAFALACGSAALAVRLLPKSATSHGGVHIPGVEIVLRMAAAFALVILIALGAETLGPVGSGIALSFPIQGSVVPAFTRYLHGHAATVHMLRGMLMGLFAFFTFFVVLALALEPVGIAAAFLLAVAATVAQTWLVGMARHKGWLRF